ncbi:DUF1294 domain-containing protein [Pseudomonas entomophila]|uniref:DUF1294 domain-containing protein n=1 Tax=Pseudomonas entomophila TaxID=312306 RepID=UPI0035C151DC
MHLRWPKVALLLALCTLPALGVVQAVLGGASPLWLAFYPLASLIAFGLYWHDKHRARTQGWRVPEKYLHLSELLGGWPGALVAQQVCRHKTRKVPFQVIVWAIVLLHEVLWCDRVVFAGQGLVRLLGLAQD